jgi:hypothetical protein
MAYVPNEPIARRVKNRVDCNSQLDHTKRCAKMAASNGHRIDRLGAQLRGKRLQPFRGQITQVGRLLYTVEKRGFGNARHDSFSTLLLSKQLLPYTKSPENRQNTASTTIRLWALFLWRSCGNLLDSYPIDGYVVEACFDDLGARK